ncbi:hypothetical protein VL20_2833 [Microcystis panniformis FACHB-1757]|uniref:Uncharacterized protein n=1 Tax=Microcystis panniformis FACHB-1757 TaxID=1638788 RepID=A0A0K1S149_9CHRO|nr:hypothetical protein VL20_2833 [Microcystis panniformis FACHB-1757]
MKFSQFTQDYHHTQTEISRLMRIKVLWLIKNNHANDSFIYQLSIINYQL